jgi:hypothetical protein
MSRGRLADLGLGAAQELRRDDGQQIDQPAQRLEQPG